jgi:nucleoside-diphosphate-sugar epimerase
MAKILVTGGLGFIGHHVVQQLESMNHQVVVVDNITDYGIIPAEKLREVIDQRLKKIKTPDIYKDDIAWLSMGSIIRNHNIDTVIHLASYPRQRVVNNNPQLGSRTMIEGLLNLLEAASQNNCARFCYVSSSMVYGSFHTAAHEDSVCYPQGSYAIMKLAGEQLVKDYGRQRLSTVIVRPSAVYGPGDIEDRVVSRFLMNAHRKQTVTVNGVEEKLDFTYVTEAAQGIIAAAVGTDKNTTYNISRGHGRTLLDAANIAVDTVGHDVEICVRDRDPEYPQRETLDIARAREDLGFDPCIDIEQGFKLYYDWIRQ